MDHDARAKISRESGAPDLGAEMAEYRRSGFWDVRPVSGLEIASLSGEDLDAFADAFNRVAGVTAPLPAHGGLEDSWRISVDAFMLLPVSAQVEELIDYLRGMDSWAERLFEARQAEREFIAGLAEGRSKRDRVVVPFVRHGYELECEDEGDGY